MSDCISASNTSPRAANWSRLRLLAACARKQKQTCKCIPAIRFMIGVLPYSGRNPHHISYAGSSHWWHQTYVCLFKRLGMVQGFSRCKSKVKQFERVITSGLCVCGKFIFAEHMGEQLRRFARLNSSTSTNTLLNRCRRKVRKQQNNKQSNFCCQSDVYPRMRLWTLTSVFRS